MDIKESSVTRRDVEARLAVVGDYVKMDYLQACLKKPLDFDTKRFVLVKLSEVYEARKMFLEAGKMIRIAADINTTFDGKIKDFVKSMELLVKGGNFDEADISFNKALAMANERQKLEIKIKRKDMLKRQADEYMKKDRRKNAMDVYEKMQEIDLTAQEKKDVRDKLLYLYEKLGKIKDYMNLKNNVNSVGIKTVEQKEKRLSFHERIRNLERFEDGKDSAQSLIDFG